MKERRGKWRGQERAYGAKKRHESTFVNHVALNQSWWVSNLLHVLFVLGKAIGSCLDWLFRRGAFF
jgi:hypothetical protein